MKKIGILFSALLLISVASDSHAQSTRSLSSSVKQLNRRVASLEKRIKTNSLQGPQGQPGQPGTPGAAGPRGESAFDPIPSQKVVSGVMGGSFYGSYLEVYASLPAPAPAALNNAAVIVKANPVLISACGSISTGCLSANEQSNQDFCRGSSTSPNPSPGVVCIYPTEMYGSAGISSQTVEGMSISTDDGTGSKHGFKAFFYTSGTGLNYFEAVWAYRAP